MLEYKASTSKLKPSVQAAMALYGITDTAITNLSDSLCSAIDSKYETLGVHYLEGIDDIYQVGTLMQALVLERFPTLIAMTNNFKEFSSIPIDDNTVRTFEQSTNAISMNEDSPVDATENITTPFVKAKTNSGNKYTDTVTHNTVDEWLKRQKISEGTIYSMQSFYDSIVRVFLDEYNRAY